MLTRTNTFVGQNAKHIYVEGLSLLNEKNRSIYVNGTL